MALSGTLGAMLQGVSQQPAYLRSDGQVTEQINFIPDVTRGLTTRPAAELGNIFYTDETRDWINVQLKGDSISLGINDGTIVAKTKTGVDVPVTNGTNAYLGRNARAYVYDNEIYVLNRDKVVAMSSNTIHTSAQGDQDVTVDGKRYYRNGGYITCLGGRFSNTYTIRLQYSDGSVAYGTYTTPDGTEAGHADQIRANYILSQLYNSITTHGGWKASSHGGIIESTMFLSDTAFDVTINGDDGDNGLTMKFADTQTGGYEDLPKFARGGQVLRIVGEAGGADDVWLRFTGGAWGQVGVWEETIDTQAPNNLDLTTMPHVLSGDVNGLTLSQGNWQGRRTGDAETNPVPSFVGETLKDITGFQSRLVVIANKNVVMSRTNIPVDFWRSSATTRLATDRIDILSTTESDYSLEWILPFDRDLVVFGLKSQFHISGVNALTPDNASIVETTNFDTSGGSRPVSTGRTILFPFQEGGFAGVKEFYSSNSVDANEAISITKVQSRYMPGNLIRMESSTNFSLMLCQTDDDLSKLFGYHYYFDGESKLQSAWYTMQFPYDVRNVFFDGATVHVFMSDTGTNTMFACSIDFDLPINPTTGYHVCLDMQGTSTAVDDVYAGQSDLYTSVDRGFVDLVFVQSTGCAVPGRVITPVAVDDLGGNQRRYYFPNTVVPAGAEVISGYVYGAEVKPTMPFFRDGEGKPISNSKLVVNNFVIYYEDSGPVSATMSSKYRAQDKVASNETVAVANDPDDPLGIGIKSGEFKLRWGERSDWSELTISTADVRPVNITEVEWEGQVLTRGRRI